jgi:hypothetical protein
MLGGLAAAGLTAGFLATDTRRASAAAPDPAGPFVVPAGYTSADVQAAVTEAYEEGKGTVYLPSGTYEFTSTVEITKPVSILSSGAAVIRLEGVDGFLFRGFNAAGTRVELPNIVGGHVQVRLLGTSFMNLYVGQCIGGDVGIQLEIAPGSGQTLDNNIFFQAISTMKYGVRMVANAPLPLYMQGNVISGNFIVFCQNAVDIHGADTSDNVTINIFDIAAIDGGFLKGSTGITLSGEKKFAGGGNTFKVPSFFGGFDEATKNSYIDFPNFLNYFYLRVADATLDYANLVNLTEGGASPFLGGNKLVFPTTFGTPLLGEPAIKTVPDVPDRSLFNGGKTISYNTLRLSCAVKALAPNGHQDFYFFTPLLDGYTNNIQATVSDDGGNSYTVSIEDESVFDGTDGRHGADQVHIRLRNAGAHADATTVVINVDINGGS